MSHQQRKGSVWARSLVFFILGVAATLTAQILVSRVVGKPPRSEPERTGMAFNQGDGPRINLKTPEKPWGRVEYKSIPLEDSSEVFLDGSERLKKPKWIFENYSSRQLAELLDSCFLNDHQKAFVLDTNHWEALTNGFAISPPDELIRGLSKETRQCLYPALARSSPANYVQNYPFRFPPTDFDERIAESGLPAKKIELIRSLTYTNSGFLCLCVDEPLQGLFTTNEFQMLVKTLYSIPSVCARLWVMPDSNIEALVKYWGRGGRAKAIRPLLESLARIPEGGSINISYFLPPFARLRLYTFPDPATDPMVAKEDCFFTALNFFNEQPDRQYLDNNNTRRALQTDYHPVKGNPMFGDLVTLLDPAGNAIHACVYLADDVVFTKNGANYLQPWVLIRIPDMMAYFPSEKSIYMTIFRRNGMD